MLLASIVFACKVVARDRSTPTFHNFSPRKSLLLEIFSLCAPARPRPMRGNASHDVVFFPYGSPLCDFGYRPLVAAQRDPGIRRVTGSLGLWALLTGAAWIVLMTRLSRSSGKGPMLLKAIEALELPKSTLLYTLVYEVRSQKGDVISRYALDLPSQHVP
ncbi:hypothetical protein H4582DRAFT_158949 [Lactarius indigo]|nr:hypothetical protein H4582DRAFT_158949 [Lactarius indigo]